MESTAVPTPEPTSRRTTAGRLRRIGLRVTVSAFVLATTLVGAAGMAWAGPEMGC